MVMTRRRMVLISTKANNDGVNGGEDTDANDEKGKRSDAAKTRLTIVSSFNKDSYKKSSGLGKLYIIGFTFISLSIA